MNSGVLGRHETPITLACLRELSEDFAAAHLDVYVRELAGRRQPPSRKEINDSLWGTIGLTGIEVAILDSPLLQRLRNVRQLGVAHWVYPGAVHTRFEHSLGVMHQVERLAATINAIGINDNHGILIGPASLQKLRIAALLHDVGHGAFSHVSETAVAGLPGVDQLSAEFSAEENVEDRTSSEIVAYYVVRSPAARRLFQALQASYGDAMSGGGQGGEAAIDEAVSFVSSAIIGRKVDDGIPLLHELISGPFDGDKLDYFVRDARFAGTPSVLDITRLLQKITVRRIETRDLPAELTKRLTNRPNGHVIFGIKWSGVAVLDEMLLARVLLYAKIYRHARIIGIEQMLKSFAEVVAKVVSAKQVMRFFYNHADDAIVAMDAGHLSMALGVPLSAREPDAQKHLDRAARILADLRRRRLTVKCFQLQSKYPADPRLESTEQEMGLTQFREEMEHPVRVLELKAAILDLVEQAIAASGYHVGGGRDELDASIAVHAVPKPKGGAKIARAYLLQSTGKPMAYREYTQINRGGWVESYLTDQPTGYIFTSEDTADFVYLAVEKLLRTKFGVLLPPSAAEAAKRDTACLAAVKRRLSDHGFYTGTPFDLRPEPASLNVAYTKQVIDDYIVPLLAAYQAPAAPPRSTPLSATANDMPYLRSTRQRRPRDPDAGVNAGRERKVRRWLAQFERDGFVETALDIMQRFRMLGRRDAVAALSGFIDDNKEFQGAVVAPFGSAPDSASIQSYMSADLIGPYISKCMGHQDLGGLDPAIPIIFVDDFIGSGHQAEDILGAGFGVSSLRQPLGEQRDLFDSAVQRRLRMGKVAFVFTAAWNAGLEVIGNAAAKVGLEAKVHAHLRDDDIPFAAGEQADAKTKAFLDYCRHVGAQLAAAEMSEGKPDRDEKSAERALGYGNKGMLLASPFNVPTQTLTVIWAKGIVDGVEWEPLLPRRKKVLEAKPPHAVTSGDAVEI